MLEMNIIMLEMTIIKLDLTIILSEMPNIVRNDYFMLCKK